MIENASPRIAKRNKTQAALPRREETTPQSASPSTGANDCAESRLNPITGDWTIFAPHRGARPDQFGTDQRVPATSKVDCPFCAGEEHTTPPPTWVAKIIADDSFQVLLPSGADTATPPAPISDWSVRVVPNKFPAVTATAEDGDENASSKRVHPLFQNSKVIGGHEVIIESPNHVQSISELDLPEIKLMLVAYQQRLKHWRKQRGIQYISLFKNVGGDAGASLQHSHSQLLATDQMPNSVENINERMRSHQARTGCCLQCDIIRAELKQKQRIVAQSNSLVAYCPYASRLPMLLRVTTKDHVDHFDQLSYEVLDDLARMIKRMTGWLETLIPNASYNMLLHTRPPGAHGNAEAFHWSLEFFPRISRVAGFEWSSQCMINTVLPELATEKYRKCAAAENPRLVL